jgi:hypothetical protein
MLRFTDGCAYCDFPRASLKYVWAHHPPGHGSPPWQGGANFWDPTLPNGGPGWSSGTVSGSVDVGPYPGTSSIHLQGANPTWYRSAFMSTGEQFDFIVGCWIYPINIGGTKTFLLFQQNWQDPNYGSVFGVQIRNDGKIILNPQSNANANEFPADFDNPSPFPHWPQPGDPPSLGISNATIPINSAPPTPGSAKGWTHICVQVHFDPVLTQGYCKLWVNGCLDLNGSGLDLQVGPNLVTQTWSSSDGSELCISQFVIQDTTGSYNNSNVSQFSQIQTIFPTSDVLTGWSGGYSQVDGNPGPGGTYDTLTTLAAPDNLFGFPNMGATPIIVGVSMGMCLSAVSQTVAGLFKVGLHSSVPTASLGPLTADQWTRQGITEVNPWTGLPWTVGDVNGTSWGIRGITGTGENLYQYFLEVLCQTGPAQCGGGSYSYGQ